MAGATEQPFAFACKEQKNYATEQWGRLFC